MIKVKCIHNYNDLELNKLITTETEPFIVTKERAKTLEEKGLVEVVEIIPEKKIEAKVKTDEPKTKKKAIIKKSKK